MKLAAFSQKTLVVLLAIAAVTLSALNSSRADLSLVPAHNWVRIVHLPKVAPAPKIINIVAGVPLTGAGDKTGGFGDVAANIVSAFELKKRDPSLTINVLVTSYRERPKFQYTLEEHNKLFAEAKTPEEQEAVLNPPSPIMTTDEIVKIMLPKLDPKIKHKPQTLHGVNFIFLEADAEDLTHFSNTQSVSDDLKAAIPMADLSLQYASNSHPMDKPLRTNSKIAFNFYEPYNDFAVLDEFHYTQKVEDGPLWISMYSGAESSGFYLEAPRDDANDRHARSEITKWLKREFKTTLALRTHLLFSYSKEAEATQVYLDAVAKIAAANPQLKYVLVTKNFPELDLSKSPPNMKVIRAASFPHSIVRSLIMESALSPLITGDTSLALALSHTTKKKTFIYEAPQWKKGAAQNMIGMLSRESGLKEKSIGAVFLVDPAALRQADARKKAAGFLSRVLMDQKLQGRIHETILRLKPRWDIYANTLNYYDFYRTYQVELDSLLPGKPFAEYVLSHLKNQGSWPKVIEQARAEMLESARSSLGRLHAALVFLKFAEQLTPEEKNALNDILKQTLKYKDEFSQFEVLVPIFSRPVVREFIQSALADATARPAAMELLLDLQKRVQGVEPGIFDLSAFESQSHSLALTASHLRLSCQLLFNH